MALKINQTKEYKSLVWKLFWKAKAIEIAWVILVLFCVVVLPIIVFNIYWHNTPQTWIGHEYCKTYSLETFGYCQEYYYPQMSEIYLFVQWLWGIFGVVIIGFAIGITWSWISANWDEAQAEAMYKIRAKRSNKRK